MTAVRPIALAALAIALYGQPKPNDPAPQDPAPQDPAPQDPAPQDISGWDKIRWGMTIAEIRSAYDIHTEPESQDNWTLLYLKPVKIGGVEMGVQVGARPGVEKMPGGDKVASVRLWSFFGLPSSAPFAGAQDFATLKTTLIQRHGHPANEESKRGENGRLIKTVLWTFPSTSIVLTLEQSTSLPNLGSIYLDYTATGR